MLHFITKLIISFALVLVIASPAFAVEKNKPQKIKVETPLVKKVEQPQKTKVEELSKPDSSYDNFEDVNKNGIDDKFEKTEKEKVKVLEVRRPSKPTKSKEPDKKNR